MRGESGGEVRGESGTQEVRAPLEDILGLVDDRSAAAELGVEGVEHDGVGERKNHRLKRNVPLQMQMQSQLQAIRTIRRRN